MKELYPQKTASDEYDDLQYAIDYYNSQNKLDARNIAIKLEKQLIDSKSHIIPPYLSHEIKWLKKLKPQTVKWIGSQIWFIDVTVIDHTRNYEYTVKEIRSASMMSFLGYPNHRDLPSKEQKNIILDQRTRVITVNNTNMMLVRYEKRDKDDYYFKTLKIDLPDRVYYEDLYFESKNGKYQKIALMVWIERWTQDMKEYIRKYMVISTCK